MRIMLENRYDIYGRFYNNTIVEMLNFYNKKDMINYILNANYDFNDIYDKYGAINYNKTSIDKLIEMFFADYKRKEFIK